MSRCWESSSGWIINDNKSVERSGVEKKKKDRHLQNVALTWKKISNWSSIFANYSLDLDWFLWSDPVNNLYVICIFI